MPFFFSYQRPDAAQIKLPFDYDPIAALSHFEALHSFTSVTMEKLPPSASIHTVCIFKKLILVFNVHHLEAPFFQPILGT